MSSGLKEHFNENLSPLGVSTVVLEPLMLILSEQLLKKKSLQWLTGFKGYWFSTTLRGGSSSTSHGQVSSFVSTNDLFI